MDDQRARETIFHLHEAGRIVEAAYEETLGEETPEISALEHLKGMATEQAVEALAAFIASANATKAAIANEAARLQAQSKQADASIAWGEQKVREILETTGKRKIQAGTFTVSLTKGREAVQLPEDFDPLSLPEECLRHRPEVWEVDKRATKDWIKKNPDEDHGGARVVRGPDSVKVK